MNLILLAMLIGAGIAVGSRLARKKRTRQAYEFGHKTGYSTGYDAGYEGSAYDLKKILGKERFQQLAVELYHESQRPAGWKLTCVVDKSTK